MDYKTIVSEFKTFVLKGNVVDLAVGVVIGAAFKSVIDSVIADLITPILGMFGGQPHFALVTVGPLRIGSFINATLSFLTIAAAVFFLIIQPMNLLKALTEKKAEEKPAEPPPMPDDVKLLIEIRDLLKSKG
jgi:large conductance mechanosensitive channel